MNASWLSGKTMDQKTVNLFRFQPLRVREAVPYEFEQGGRKVINSCDYMEIDWDALPSFLREVFPRPLPKKLLIRSCYKYLFAKYKDILLGNNYEEITTLHGLMGMPKVGKTMFFLYFIFRIANDQDLRKIRFVVSFSLEEKYYFIPKGERQYIIQRLGISQLQSMTNIRLLLCEYLTSEFFYLKNITIVYSSLFVPALIPTKLIELRFQSRCIIPTWSYHELAFLSSNISSWFSRYCKYGGVPYYLFDYFDEDMIQSRNNEVDTEIQLIIQTQGKQLLEALFQDEILNLSFRDHQRKKDYFRMVHVNPATNRLTGQVDFQSENYRLEFVSDYVLEQLNRQHHTEFLEAINGKAPCNASSTHRQFTSYFYQKFCFAFLPILGATLSLTRTYPLDELSLTLPAKKKKYSIDWEIVPFERDTLYVPAYSGQYNDYSCAFMNIEGRSTFLLFIFCCQSHKTLVYNVVEELVLPIKDMIERKIVICLTPINSEVSMPTIEWQYREPSTMAIIPRYGESYEYYFAKHGLR